MYLFIKYLSIYEVIIFWNKVPYKTDLILCHDIPMLTYHIIFHEFPICPTVTPLHVYNFQEEKYHTYLHRIYSHSF